MPIRGFSPSFAGGLLGPGLQGRIDLAKYDVGLRVASNIIINTSGGFSNRMGTEFIAECADSTKTSTLVPFQPTVDETYVIEFSEGVARFVQDAGMIVETGTAITAVTLANPVVVTSTAHLLLNGQRVFISGIVGTTELNGRTFTVRNVTANTVELEDMWGVAVDSTAYTAWISGGTIQQILEIASPYTAVEAEALNYAQSADVLYMTHRTYPTKKFQRLGALNWTITDLVFDPTNAIPTGVAVVADDPTGGQTYTYTVSAVDENGIESFPATEASVTNAEPLDEESNFNTVTWVASAGAEEYRIYRELNGIFGFVGFTVDLTFKDQNISPDTTDTPVESFTDLQAVDEYPGVVALYQQRLVLASTNDLPENIWMSRTGAYENFTKSRITKATDRIETAINGNFLQGVRHMMPLRELLTLTNAGEWALSGVEGVMAPGKEVITQHGYAGSAIVRPVVVNDSILYVERYGNVVRDLRYAFETDGYLGNELSIYVQNLFRDRTIRDWTYARSPFSIIWCVMSDGDLLSLTYHREHQVWAWAEHDVGGEVESIASVEEGSISAVYMVVKRTINSQTKRYIERLGGRAFTDVEDAYFVDCGLTYSGAAATSISGLEHLEGETLVSLADGDVVRELVVSGGAVTLPNAAEKAHVGYAYVADAETLPTSFSDKRKGQVRGIVQKINRASVQIERTRGIALGPSEAGVIPWRQDTPAAGLHVPKPLFTGIVDVHVDPLWTKDGTIWVKQIDPLPMTILGIAPSLTIGQ